MNERKEPAAKFYLNAAIAKNSNKTYYKSSKPIDVNGKRFWATGFLNQKDGIEFISIILDELIETTKENPQFEGLTEEEKKDQVQGQLLAENDGIPF